MAESSYLRHLPAIFRAAGPDGAPPFLGEFLKIFEALLSGRDDARALGVRGIEDVIALFPEYIDPALTPIDNPDAADDVPLRSEFLDYLASWAALTLDQNWSLEKKREWARRIMPLYRRRGTRDGLQDYLHTFVGNDVTVDEPPGGFIIAAPDNSTVGVNSFIAGGPAYFFRVRINYAYDMPFDITEWVNVRRGTRAIVELEKPAHTYYSMDTRTPGFIVAQRATISADTLLWRRSRRI
jgi:phage tail-like protein